MNINRHKRNFKKDIFFNEIPRMKVPSLKSKLCILVFAITLILKVSSVLLNTVVYPNSHIFVRFKSGDYLGTMCLFGYMEDFASKVWILVLDFDFCLLFEKYFLIKKSLSEFTKFSSREKMMPIEKKRVRLSVDQKILILVF